MNNQPTRTVLTDGTEEWHLNNQLHRTDGPAITYPDGTQRWCLNGQLHRPDGPAVTMPDGTTMWWIFGRRIHAGTEQLNALYAADRIAELRLILETWTLGGPNIDDLAAAVEQTVT